MEYLVLLPNKNSCFAADIFNDGENDDQEHIQRQVLK
jgi:hypothetical protein